MDFNGSSYDGSGLLYTDLPLGFGMSLAMNEGALNGYAALTEAEKENVIMRCKGARTKEQMQKIVDSLVPGTDVQEVIEEEKEQLS